MPGRTGAGSGNRRRPRPASPACGASIRGDIGFVGQRRRGRLDRRRKPGLARGRFDRHRRQRIPLRRRPRRDAPRPGDRAAPGQRHRPDRLAGCVDGSTRIIAASYVSYLTGERVDLPALRRLADKSARCCWSISPRRPATCRSRPRSPTSPSPPATNGCSALPASPSPTGTAPASRIGRPPPPAGIPSRPGTRGYDTVPALQTDAMRFTRGNPAHCSIYVLNSALSYLSRFDMRDVQRHVQTLTVALLRSRSCRSDPRHDTSRPCAARRERLHRLPTRRRRSSRRCMRGAFMRGTATAAFGSVFMATMPWRMWTARRPHCEPILASRA